MKPSVRFLLCSAVVILLISCQKTITAKSGVVKFTFQNMVDNSPMVLDAGTVYTNPFGEKYTISKFRYYISNISLTGAGSAVNQKSVYHLVDQAVQGSQSFGFETDENSFSGLHFLIGVDSLRNVSGAQAGALDPLNDMFWTWNSGYVMAKMEGTSPQSTLPENIIQYHIGGFSGANNVLKQVDLSFPAGKQVTIKQDQTTEVIVKADFNTWWQSPNDLKITEVPVCTTPGAQAKKIADNYSKMFTVTDIVNN